MRSELFRADAVKVRRLAERADARYALITNWKTSDFTDR